jgi:hypothetical protein
VTPELVTGGDAARGRGAWLRSGRAPVAVAASLDVIWLVAFVLLGRSSHTEGESLGGVARTLWPFLVGLALGWATARAWRRPAVVVPTALVLWPVCVVVAMVLRALSGQGVAAAFVGVALVFVGLGLLGWRAIAGLAHRVDRPRAA